MIYESNSFVINELVLINVIHNSGYLETVIAEEVTVLLLFPARSTM